MPIKSSLLTRQVAINALKEVESQRRPLDEALNSSLAKLGRNQELEPRDRAFAQLIASTTVRRSGELRALLKSFLSKPLKSNQQDLSLILRSSLTQLLYLGTPLHAVASTAKGLASQPHLKGFQGLITAILRRAEREGADAIEKLDAQRLNTPDWLWDSWTVAYGEDVARAIAQAHLQDPLIDLTLKEPQTLNAWRERLAATALANGSLRLARGQGDIAALPGFTEGAWWVQDAAASLPAKLLEVQSGEKVFDLCAAPGGKSCQLAAAGAEVTAIDLDRDRLNRVEANAKRLKLPIATRQADLLNWTPPFEADAVLLDAPCSATGTIRRHPDCLILKRASDVPRFADLQGKLLDRAAGAVKPGGRLVYAVCSLQPEEGLAQIEAFLERSPNFQRKAVTPSELPELEEAISAEGDLRSLPCHWADKGGMDGFFASRLVRTG